MSRGLVGCSAALDLLFGLAKVLADGRGHRRGVDHVLSRHGDGERVTLLCRRHDAANAVDAKVFDLADADIAVLGQAAAQRFLRQRDGVQKLVVAV